MTMTPIRALPACECPDDICEEICEPVGTCVYRIAREGSVVTAPCPNHTGWSWHLDGVCLSCNPRKGKEGLPNKLLEGYHG